MNSGDVVGLRVLHKLTYWPLCRRVSIAVTQSEHMSPKVDLKVADQRVIRCDLCEYSCRYTIQYKKHVEKQHKPDKKYNCKFCEFTTDFMTNAWDHKLEAHPDVNDEFTKEESKDLVMKIVAEQMDSVLEEMESLKSVTKDAFIELTKTLKTCVAEVKADNNEKPQDCAQLL